jgi:hypothetical protein
MEFPQGQKKMVAFPDYYCFTVNWNRVAFGRKFSSLTFYLHGILSTSEWLVQTPCV